MSYSIIKPCSKEQRADFVVLHNHQNGRKIVETENFIYALEANEIFENDEPTINENYESEQLTLAKKQKCDEANNAARYYLESGNALYQLEDGNHIEATDGNIGKLGAYALGFITGTYSQENLIYWNTKEDKTVSLTQSQLTKALLGVGKVQAEIWNVKYPAYLAQIEACKTADEVNSIIIDYAMEVNNAQENITNTNEVDKNDI